MQFKEYKINFISVNDRTVYEYIKECEKKKKEYNINDFLEFVNTKYYLPNFSFEYNCSYDLKDDYFINELKRIKEKYND